MAGWKDWAGKLGGSTETPSGFSMDRVMRYKIYVFPNRFKLKNLIARLQNRKVPFSTFPNRRIRRRGKTVTKKPYCIIVEGDISLLEELREFGKLRFEPLTPTH